MGEPSVQKLAVELATVAAAILGVTVDEIDPDHPYTTAGEVATAAAERWATLPAGVKRQFFDYLAPLIDQGSALERNLIIVGFIEDLQNVLLARHLDLELPPGTARPVEESWQVVQDLWGGRLSTADFNEFVDRPGRASDVTSI